MKDIARTGAWLAAAAMALSSCSGNTVTSSTDQTVDQDLTAVGQVEAATEEDSNASDSVKTSSPDDHLTEFRFDGSSCEISGDLDLTPGLNRFLLIDTANEPGEFDFVNMADGHTMVEAFAVWEDTAQSADFVISSVHSHFAGGEKFVTFNLVPGTWQLACTTDLHLGRWYSDQRVNVG